MTISKAILALVTAASLGIPVPSFAAGTAQTGQAGSNSMSTQSGTTQCFRREAQGQETPITCPSELTKQQSQPMQSQPMQSQPGQTDSGQTPATNQ
ncbi:MAG TPA: hypothetical protein VL418_07950 [Devosiaceae bacterium]|nr:hypothetical protein [Devosiaceae bacterium]